MKNFNEHAQDHTTSAPMPRSTAPAGEHQPVEAEHWEALLTLLTQPRAVASPAIVSRARKAVGGPTTIAPEPLLKPEPSKQTIKIARSTAESFPLPSIVPNAQTAKQNTQPVKQTAEPVVEPVVARSVAKPIEKPVAEKAAPVTMHEDDEPALPAARLSNRVESRQIAAMSGPIPEKLTESWTERLAQRVFSSFGQNRASRANNTKPVNHAEVAYNPQGKVDYVTYTINAPMRKNHGGSR